MDLVLGRGLGVLWLGNCWANQMSMTSLGFGLIGLRTVRF